jgi:peptidoglycan/xylan/chitin deacetylase (PgdA/CDA1 family)
MTCVLLYHDVVERDARERAGFPGPLAARYKLDPVAFAMHLDAIAATGSSVGLLDDSPRPDVTFIFDDGGASTSEIASALEERGWRGYFFVPTARIGTPGFAAAEALRGLLARGHGVGSHSHTHPTYMGALTRTQLDDEWRRSRDVLASLLGREPDTASVPGGFLSRAVIESAASAGYSLLMTSEPTTRVTEVEGMTVIGRFAIKELTRPGEAAAYARADRRARARLWLGWRAKTAAKRVSPRVYQGLRVARTRL